MKKKKINTQDQYSEGTNKKPNEDPEKTHPNPDDPNEEMGPPIKEMPLKDGAKHPHDEEILGGIPK